MNGASGTTFGGKLAAVNALAVALPIAAEQGRVAGIFRRDSALRIWTNPYPIAFGDIAADSLGHVWDAEPGAAGLGAFKTALQLMGIIESNTMSVPMPSLNETETTAIKVILERNGLL